MKAMILNIGAEVLSGKVVNTNAAFIGSELRKIGIETERIAVVGDNPDMIKNELVAFQNSSSKILITTGGLGPTHDDLTKEVICNFLGLKTEKREDPLKRLEEYFGGSFPEVNKKQAEFPKEALLLDNKIGTAPGAIIPYQDKIYILLVGPYTEMKLMFADSVLPYLQEISGKNINASEFTVMGKSESAFEENLSNLYRSYPDVNIASYPEEGKIRFVLQSTNFETYQEALGEFKKLMKDYIVSESGESIEEVVVGLLKNKGYKI
ncbi:MAG TPA: molybdopterin-binding protein, partial [Bacilli bacterium]